MQTKEWSAKKIVFQGLGAWAVPGGIYFSVEADPETVVFLVLFDKKTGELLEEIPMPADPWQGRIRSILLERVRPEKVTYLYKIDGKLRMDPAARLVVGSSRFGLREAGFAQGLRGGILYKNFEWGEAEQPPAIPGEDIIACCVHVRGYTMDRMSGVRHKGTFRGLEEKIPYLEELGINQVVLMPAYDFNELVQPDRPPLPDYARALDSAQDSMEAAPPEMRKVNFWGYAPGFYFAPKAGYAAGPDPDLEFKNLVKQLHARKIELLMEFAFPDDISLTYITECLGWWVREYHVDGFLLMMRHDAAQLISRAPALGTVRLITDYFEQVPAAGFRRHRRLLSDCHNGFMQDARRFLKGDENVLEAFVGRARANFENKCVYNYITGHDGFTLNDLVSYEKKHNEANGQENMDGPSCDYSWNCGVEGPSRRRQIVKLREQQMRNAFALLLLSQGAVMLRGGDEFCNSQDGNNNPWCQDNETGWINWKGSRSHADMTAFVKELIKLRKKHPALHQRAVLTGQGQSRTGYPDFSCHSSRAWYPDYSYQSREIGLLYCLDDPVNDYVYVAYNMHWEEKTLALPYLPKGLKWEAVLDTADPDNANKGMKTPGCGTDKSAAVPDVSQITVGPRSVRVLVCVPEKT